MSLDITILDADGSPAEEVSVDLENYGRLMEFVGDKDCLLRRLNDYYDDAEFENTELDKLIKELLTVREQGHNNEQFVLFVDSFIALAGQAWRNQQSLFAIAD
jgi:hypothetical protein